MRSRAEVIYQAALVVPPWLGINARCSPPSKGGRPMSTVQPFPAGGYRFISYQFQYSGGVGAEPGFRIDFRTDIRASNRVALVAENAPGGQPLDIMPIERDEPGVGKLRRGAQLAGAERRRRASDAAEVGFDRVETFGPRHGSRETRALDAEAGLGANPA